MFQFKQFAVAQDRCALKITTDSVLLGAWAAFDAPKTILDIGTGTGVITLMLAQRYPDAQITAIDIDTPSAAQAAQNFVNSAWRNRLTAAAISLQDFVYQGFKFDAIISNPPYFHNSLRAPDAARNAARHTDELRFDELIACAAQLLNPNGQLAVILPTDESAVLARLAAYANFHLSSRTSVCFRSSKPAERRLMLWHYNDGNNDGNNDSNNNNGNDIIKQKNTDTHLYIHAADSLEYTPEYIALTKDFYLKM